MYSEWLRIIPYRYTGQDRWRIRLVGTKLKLWKNKWQARRWLNENQCFQVQRLAPIHKPWHLKNRHQLHMNIIQEPLQKRLQQIYFAKVATSRGQILQVLVICQGPTKSQLNFWNLWDNRASQDQDPHNLWVVRGKCPKNLLVRLKRWNSN